jgi:hypothetical protein
MFQAMIDAANELAKKTNRAFQVVLLPTNTAKPTAGPVASSGPGWVALEIMGPDGDLVLCYYNEAHIQSAWVEWN